MTRSLPLLFLLLCATGAHASDLAAAPEIGSTIHADTGWYGRVDAAHSLANGADGMGYGAPGPEASGWLDEGDAFVGGIGIGYKFSDIWRMDATARYGSFDVSGSAEAASACGTDCRLDIGARRETVDLDLNVYADLGTIVGLTPYVGAGLGVGHVAYEAPAASLCSGSQCGALGASGDDGWRANLSLMAGAAYAVSDRMLLDLGYRYTHSGDGDLMRFGLADGSTVTMRDDGSERHLVTLGLRVRFD